MTAHQVSAPATGCVTGQAPSSGTGAFPKRSRSAVVTALIGFHSATVRSQPGRLSVGMYAFDSSGRMNVAPPS